MSDIKAGDFVAVVRSCCAAFIEHSVFHVQWVRDVTCSEANYRCAHCKTVLPRGVWASRSTDQVGYPTQWLKRIPPLSELDDVKRDEEITA